MERKRPCKAYELRIAEQGHAKCFGIRILEIIEANKEAFHCGCR